MKTWACKRMCIHDGHLTYPGTTVEAEVQPSEHFVQVGGSVVQAGFADDDTFDAKTKLAKITKEQMIAFAGSLQLPVDAAETKAEVFDAIVGGINIIREANLTKDAVLEELQIFVKPNE